jgi:hypothetical protein
VDLPRRRGTIALGRRRKWKNPNTRKPQRPDLMPAGSCRFKESLNYTHHIRLMKVMSAISIVAVFSVFCESKVIAMAPANWLG